MAERVPQNPASVDAARRSRSLRALLLTVLLTSFLLVPEEIRNVVSMDAPIVAVTTGVLAGAVASVALDRFQIRAGNDVRTTVTAFVSTGVVAVLCWMVIPMPLRQTVPQFALAFLWGFSIVSVARDVLWPEASDLMSRIR